MENEANTNLLFLRLCLSWGGLFFSFFLEIESGDSSDGTDEGERKRRSRLVQIAYENFGSPRFSFGCQNKEFGESMSLLCWYTY